MNNLKRILSVILCVILMLCTGSTGFEGISGLISVKADAAYTEALKENEDGSFRVLQLSDIQDNSYLSAKAFATVRLAVRKYRPDLIVLTGDNILNCKGDEMFHTTVDSLVDEFVDANGNKIPFAVTFGNHDYEINYHDEDKTEKISLKEQYEYYLSKGAVNLTQDGLDTSAVSSDTAENSATLWGTGYIDVYTNDGSKISRRVILLNTGSYDNDMSNRNRFARVGYNVETGEEESYSNVVSAVNTWTNAVNNSGEKIKCIVYQHIALQEVYLGDSPAESILTKPTVVGSITHASYKHINNDVITVNPDGAGRRQYVVSTKNPTLTGTFDEAPKSSYNSTKDLFITLASNNVIGLFYGHDHGNTVSAETKITYDGVKYTLTQGFGGGIDVYDGNYNGIDPQGSIYVIDKDGDLIKEAFSYTGLLTEGITYPSGDESVKYIKEVALFNGSTFENACDEARIAGYTPVTSAFSEGYNYADLNSNDRGSRYFTGNGNQYECIAYKQTTNPDEAITDLRVYVTTDGTYSRSNQTKTYTLNGNESGYRIVPGCDGNVNYGVASNTSCAFLYYSKNKNAGSPLTELIVEVQESSSVDAYRLTDHRSLQTGNFVETFGTNQVSSFSNVRIANMNLGSTRDTVVGDSVYLFIKRYDGVSGYNTKTSYDVLTAVPQTIYLDSDTTDFNYFVNNSLENNGVLTAESEINATTGKLYFYCPDAASVNVTATDGAGDNAVTLSSCTVSNGGSMINQSNGLFFAEVTDGTVSGLSSGSSGVIKWVFSYFVTGSSTEKTQIAYSTVGALQTTDNVNTDKASLREFILNFNQSAVVKDANTTYNGENGFADALADASYVLGNPVASQIEVDAAKTVFVSYADKTSLLYTPIAPNSDTEELIEECGGYIYGICQPVDSYSDTLKDTGFGWVRFDIPCPFNSKGGITSRYREFKARCQEYHDKGFKVLAVTPYPKDLLWDMGYQTPPFSPIDDIDSFMDVARDVIQFIYNDVKDDGNGGSYVDALQITNEMGITAFTTPLTLEQAATYIGVQLEAIDEIRHTDDKIQIGYNSADLTLQSKYLHELLRPYYQYCDYVAIDLYTGNQGEATAKDYAKKVRDLYSITQKPVIITEFGFWSAGGLKTAEQKAAILYDNYGYSSEAEAIADGENFINKLPDDFISTLQQAYPDQEEQWPSLVFSRYSNHFYGETSPHTINDIAHSPEGQGEYFRQVMTELKKVECLAGMIIYNCRDMEACFVCGHSWCPYETKFGIFNYDGTPKASVAVIKDTIATLRAEDALKSAAEESTAVYGESSKTTVSVYHKSGSKNIACDAGEIYKGSTITTSTKSIPGYSCAATSETTANITTPVSKTYNTYSPVNYTATKDIDGVISTASFRVDGMNLQLEAPQKDGYIFTGWKVTQVAGNTLNKTNFIKNKLYSDGIYSGMYGNVTLEAQWKKVPYTVTFDISNGGSALSFASKEVCNGEPYGNLAAVTPPDGLYFSCWNTKKDGSGTVISDKTICTLTADQTLYACYSDVKYTVLYDNLFAPEVWVSKGGNSPSKTNESAAVYNADNNSISLTYSNPDGVSGSEVTTSTNANCMTIPVTEGKTYSFSVEVKATNATQGWANFQLFVFDNTGYTALCEGGSYVNNNSSKVIKSTYTAPSGATKATIRFSNKTTGSTLTYKNVRFVEKTVNDRLDDFIIYPCNFDTVVSGSSYSSLPEPTRPAYIFGGWYSDADLTDKVDENTVVTGDITLYSKWIDINEVTYDNLFSITEYAASKSKNLNEISGTADIDYEKGSITVPGNPVDGGNSPYTSWNTDTGYYSIPVTGGTKYYLSFYIDNWGGNVFVNFNSGTATDTDMVTHSGKTYIGGVLSGNKAQKYTFYFKAPSGATKIGLRFGASGNYARTYSNIKLIDEARYYSEAVYDSSFGYVYADSTYGDLQTPTRKGYGFDGWYTEDGTKITSASSTGTSNVKLFSRWADAFDIIYNSIFDFDLWGANQNKSGTTYNTTVDYGTNSYTITADSNHTGEVTSTANGSGVYRMPVVANHRYKVSADITTGINNPTSVKYNLLIFEWPETYDVWSGYLSPLNEKSFTLDPGVTQTCSIEFTAKANADTISLRLALKSSGASEGTFSNIRIQDMTATPYPEAFVQMNAVNSDSLITQPDREGYNCEGWYDNISGTQYTNALSFTGNTILYANYSQMIYDVTYLSTVGTEQKVLSMSYGENPTTAYVPEANGYRFVGWYSDEGLRTYAPLTVTEPLTLYAKWLANTYNVTFDSNGGTCVTSGKKVEFNNAYGKLPMPEKRTGFDFKGWYDSADDGNLITEDSIMSVTEDVTLYAHWEHDTFEINITGDVTVENKFIFGNDLPGMSKEELSNQFANSNISVTMNTNRMSTGTTVNLVDDTGAVYDTATVVIFGDTNRDGWYDGTDALIVKMLLNGMLTREQVGEAVYMASDCNHDGVIDELDVEILEQAGVLLSGVDQTKSAEELEASSAYQEYLSLIDQSPATEKNEKPTQETKSFADILSLVIKSIIAFFNSFAKRITGNTI